MGFGPDRLFVGPLQVGLAVMPHLGPITLEFNGLSFLISQGKESLVKENKQATFFGGTKVHSLDANSKEHFSYSR